MKKTLYLKELKKEIKKLKNKLLKVSENNNLSAQIVQETSQKLDKVILEYTKEKNR